jgi:hypothetical protein
MFKPWHPRLIKKLRSLKIISALLAVERTTKEEYQAYDLIAIALNVFDLVIENMGVGSGITREQVVERIAPVIRAADEVSGKTSALDFYDDLINYVIDKLLNRSSHESIEIHYKDYSLQRPVDLSHRFWLLSEKMIVGSGIVLYASAEAINIFLQLLEVDLENQQKAMLFLIDKQMENRNFSQAIETAIANKHISIAYREDILAKIRQTRRDIELVDWTKDAPLTLEKALDHLSNCIQQETARKDRGREQLNQILPSDYDKEEVRQLRELVKVLEETIAMHGVLQGDIMDTRDIYRNEQTRQVFKPLPKMEGMNLEADVFDKVMHGSVVKAEAVLDRVLTMLEGIKTPKILNLNPIIDSFLKVRHRREKVKGSVWDTEFSDHEAIRLSYFPPGIAEKASAFIRENVVENGGRITLSGLFALAAAANQPPYFIDTIKYMIINRFSIPKVDTDKLDENIVVELRSEVFENELHRGEDFTVMLIEPQKKVPGEM